MLGCRLPSPAWKTLPTRSPCSATISFDARAGRREAWCAGRRRPCTYVAGRDATVARRMPPCAPSRAAGARPRPGRCGSRALPRSRQACDDALGLRVHPDGKPVQLDEQHRRGVARIAARGTQSSTAWMVRWSIISIAAGTMPARDDGRHRARRPRSIASKTASTVLTACGLRQDAHDDLGRDPERALAADEDAGQVVAGRVARLAAEPHDLAVGQHDLEPEHVIRGDAVLQAVRPAGVLGDVAADRARLLARRIGRVVEPVGATPRERCRLTSPGCTTAIWLSESTSSTRFIRMSEMTMPPSAGRPARRARCPRRGRRTEGPRGWPAYDGRDLRRLVGNTTKSASARKRVRPSDS